MFWDDELRVLAGLQLGTEPPRSRVLAVLGDQQLERGAGVLVPNLDSIDAVPAQALASAFALGEGSWGGFVARDMPVLHPDRCLRMIGVNTPYIAFPTIDSLRAVFPDLERMYRD